MRCSSCISRNKFLPRLGLILCLACSAQSYSAAESVQSLRYGVGLYYFYQQDYFNYILPLSEQLDCISYP